MSCLGRGVGGNDGPPRMEGHRNETCHPGAEDVGENDSVCHLEAYGVDGVTVAVCVSLEHNPPSVGTWDGQYPRASGMGLGKLGEGRRDLLHVLGPGRRVTHGHEHAVGQDGDHDEHAEQRWGEGQGK